MGLDRAIASRSAALLPAVALYGVAFGSASQLAGLPVSKTIGLSLLVFGGGSQFAAVGVIASGGSSISAVLTGLLINTRMLAFGVAIAPILPRSWRQRLAASQFVIDETVALATAERDVHDARKAFWYTAISLWVVWNASAIAGATVLSSLGDPANIGLDAATPAAFLGLVAPRLRNRDGASAALAGAAIALVLIPLVPAGVPVMASAVGAIGVLIVAARRSR
jgi:4-azaleucine resistance transporter AzlC